MMSFAFMMLSAVAAQPVPDVYAVARCAVGANVAAVDRRLRAAPVSEAAAAADAALRPVLARCGVASGDASPELLGALAERMIRTQFEGVNFAQMFRPVVETQATTAQMRRETAAWPAEDAATTCVARLQGREVSALLRTRAGSGDEERAIRDLGPTLSRCVDTGAALKTSRAGLRAAFARSYYRYYISAATEEVQ